MPGAKITCGEPNRVRTRTSSKRWVRTGARALADPRRRAEVLRDQRPDLSARDGRRPGARRLESALDRVHDQSQGTTGLEHVVHHLGDAGLVRPVEGLAERHQPKGARCGRRKLLGQRLDPVDVRDAPFVGEATSLGEHCRIGIETDRFLEEVGEPEREDAGPAAAVEEPSRSVQAELRGENCFELW